MVTKAILSLRDTIFASRSKIRGYHYIPWQELLWLYAFFLRQICSRLQLCYSSCVSQFLLHFLAIMKQNYKTLILSLNEKNKPPDGGISEEALR